MNFPKTNQHVGPMAGHVRKGRVFMSPLMATGTLQAADWFKDDLPDLLWPALVLATDGNESIERFVRWQKAVQNELAEDGDVEFVANHLDGRLTHLATLAEKLPSTVDVVTRQATRFELLPPLVRRALGAYQSMPVSWLTGQVSAAPPELSELELIRDALLGVLQDRHREALIKCLPTWSTLQAGTFRSDAMTMELLKDYPRDEASRNQADTVVRAGWGAGQTTVLISDPEHFAGALQWARAFWGANSMTSRCIRDQDSSAISAAEEEDASSESLPESDEHAAATPVPENGAHLRQLAMDLLSSFVEALERSPASLHDKERQEVVAGLVARAGRDLIAVLTAPDLWRMEHGAHLVRMLVETKIYLRWMALQEPSIYREFQEYGAGKAKLYGRIVDELPAEARTSGYQDAIDEFERLSHNGFLDHRVVDTRDSFASRKSIRAMAEEAGLLDFYRQTYSLASGVSHSEWWSVETHAMEPCVNVLHGRHLIPSLSLNNGGNVPLATSWVNQFYSLVRSSLDTLGTNSAAVSAAFAWLDSDVDVSD